MTTPDLAVSDAPKMETPTGDTTPETPQITIDDFLKVDLRIGRVVTAERVPKSRKLVCLEIDDGSGVRQVLGGLAKSYEPAALVGVMSSSSPTFGRRSWRASSRTGWCSRRSTPTVRRCS